MCGRIQSQDVFKVHIQNLFDLGLIKNLLIILFNHLICKKKKKRYTCYWAVASLHLTGVSQMQHILIILRQIFLELHIMYHPSPPTPTEEENEREGQICTSSTHNKQECTMNEAFLRHMSHGSLASI